MITIEKGERQVPVKAWIGCEQSVEESCLKQAYHLASLPFVHKWVALMPDTHTGMGMPIGGVIATDGVIIPNAVGVDIGCGMGFIGTDLPASILKETRTGSGSLVQGIVGDLLRSIPVNFRHHQKRQACKTLDRAQEEMEKYDANPELVEQIEAGYYQVGTLGGGNHFIELQEDDQGMLGIMVHSGSRNFGKQICDAFHMTARQLNAESLSAVPDEWRLAYLPLDSAAGQQYIRWMNLALDFAKENRAHMLTVAQEVLERWVAKYVGTAFSYVERINCHHNYAALERHYGKEVWVHRKGATRAQSGERTVIPGAMGSYSYVVEGLGSPESFCSSSHGAGRRYARKTAMEKFSTEQVMLDLKEQNVVLGKHNKADVAEESRFAYKDIDEVMEQQHDLVRPVKKLKTIGVIKG
jgi:tRNA-splicing ligase RtcB